LFLFNFFDIIERTVRLKGFKMRESHKKKIIEDFLKRTKPLFEGFEIKEVEIKLFKSEENNLSVVYHFEITYQVHSEFMIEKRTDQFLEQTFEYDNFIVHRY